MNTLRNEVETIFFIILATCSVLLMMQFQKLQKNEISFSVQAVSDAIHPIPIMQQTSVPFVPMVTTSFVSSSDGNMTLFMRTTGNRNNTTTYAFFLSSIEKNTPFFTEIASGSSQLSLPFNSWSPDNTYFYIVEKNPAVTHAFIFKANGEQFSTTQQYGDISPLFTEEIKKYTLKEVTGWASPTLLIINTTDKNNSQGQSYWYDVPRQSLIALSTKF